MSLPLTNLSKTNPRSSCACMTYGASASACSSRCSKPTRKGCWTGWCSITQNDLTPTGYLAETGSAPTEYPLATVRRLRAGAASDPWRTLTDAELRVAELVAGGLTNRNIAEYVNLSPHTVDAHLKHIYIKLDIHSRVELTVLALQHRSAMTTSPSLRHPSRDGLRGSDRSIRPTLPSSDGKVGSRGWVRGLRT